MTEFLLFTLYAPLASWGEIAVGESRRSWDRPSRSAVLGLVGAALGLLRTDQEDHDALDRGYGFAVRLDAPGTRLVDYHTAQTVDSASVRRRQPATRAELLASGDPETILSRREYRQDAVATAALWSRDGARWTLEQLADALRRPVFVLSAGRKANVFALPLAPTVVAGLTLADALRARHPLSRNGRNSPEPIDAAKLGIDSLEPEGGWGDEVAYDRCGALAGMETVQTVVRRDAGAHRDRWQFAERAVEISHLTMADDAILVQEDGS